jgi:hypothetical protein
VPSEFVRSLRGAWLLARGDAAGMGLLDLTVEGFWNSFAAALVAAPAYVLLLADRYAGPGCRPGRPRRHGLRRVAGLPGRRRHAAAAGHPADPLPGPGRPLRAAGGGLELGDGARRWRCSWAAVVLGLALPPMRERFLLAAVGHVHVPVVRGPDALGTTVYALACP